MNVLISSVTLDIAKKTLSVTKTRLFSGDSSFKAKTSSNH